MIKTTLILTAFLCVVFSSNLYAKDIRVLQTDSVKILFEAPLESAAKDVAVLYPEIVADLETIFEWKLHRLPTVVLIKKREDFLQMAENSLTVAFAVPAKNLIVIDYSQMITDPFSLESSLGHELCHLLLHRHIPSNILPRWLDEGFAQWVSNSINEILVSQKRSVLSKAAYAKKIIRLRDLRYRFPVEKSARRLAYEESKSFIAYIIRTFGKTKTVNLLKHLENGEKIEIAFLKELSIPLDTLEEEWHRSLRSKNAWFIFLSHYLYEILFALMALLTLYAFIRSRLIKRNYVDDDEEEEEEEEEDYFSS